MQNTLVLRYCDTLNYTRERAHRARVYTSANRNFLLPVKVFFLSFFFLFLFPRVRSLFVATFLQCASHVRAIKGISVGSKPVDRRTATRVTDLTTDCFLKRRKERKRKKKRSVAARSGVIRERMIFAPRQSHQRGGERSMTGTRTRTPFPHILSP